MPTKFTERLWPSRVAVGYLILMSVSFAAAAAREYGGKSGWIALSVCVALSALGWWGASPIVQVTDEGIRAGQARLPWSAIGRVTLLEAQATKEAHGIRAHPRAYLLIRGWIPQSVIIEVTDEFDPHPYWQISTRAPHTLVAALELRGQ